jgi:hypothetical protein
LSTDTNTSDNFAEKATSTAKTSFAGVIVHSTAAAEEGSGPGTVMTDAVAQGGSGQASMTGGDDAESISTVLPDKAYATTLIGGASNVADALLGPRDRVLGAAILQENLALFISDATSTFDFRDQGDLLVGVIDGFDFDITVNGTQVFTTDGSVTDTVIDLGSNFGPNIELTFDGSGAFAFGGAVPEVSTWAMLMLGFGALGLIGYRQTRGASPQGA